MKTPKPKFIFSAGGTGGHIYPALATADALRDMLPEAEILFIGAEHRMEMEKVPHHGYPIIGLPIQGIQRRLTLKNFVVPFKIVASLLKARKILKQLKPDVVAGFGGYASGPVLFIAALLGIKIFIQEQNSYPGITNKILSHFAKKIFVAYDNLNLFFNPKKIILTGNPVRKDISIGIPPKSEALKFFNLSENKKTILIIGGSLGARTINEAIENSLHLFAENNIQVLWQTGKIYYDGIIDRTKNINTNHVKILQFIREMNMAYSAADIIISRAGALSISELCIVGKPAILVPSPNVSEDHQTKNAMALVTKNAAILVKDNEAKNKLGTVAVELLYDEQQQNKLAVHIKSSAKINAANDIVTAIIAQQK